MNDPQLPTDPQRAPHRDDIDHPGEWIVLGAISATALGTVVAIKSR